MSGGVQLANSSAFSAVKSAALGIGFGALALATIGLLPEPSFTHEPLTNPDHVKAVPAPKPTETVFLPLVSAGFEKPEPQPEAPPPPKLYGEPPQPPPVFAVPELAPRETAFSLEAAHLVAEEHARQKVLLAAQQEDDDLAVILALIAGLA